MLVQRATRRPSRFRPALDTLEGRIVPSAGSIRATVAPVTELTMNSQPGDDIGGGKNYSFSPSDGSFNVQNSANDNYVQISFSSTDGSNWWYLDFQAPNNAALTPGTYTGAVRYPFQAANQPGLSVYGDGVGSNTLTGQFTVLQAVYGPSGQVISFAATFVQHSDGLAPALTGEIDYNATDTDQAIVQFSSANYSANVTDGSAQVVVNRVGDLSAGVSVVVASPGGGGVAAFSRTITIGANVSSQSVPIPIVNDGVPGKSDVSIPVYLSSPSTDVVTGALTSATLVLHDNNPFPPPAAIVGAPTFPWVTLGTGHNARKVRVIELQFNTYVFGANHVAAYQLLSGQTKNGVTTFTTNVPLKLAVYDATTHTVTLFPAGKLNLSLPEELRVSSSLIVDAFDRPLDGNHDGQPGGDFVATFIKHQITII